MIKELDENGINYHVDPSGCILVSFDDEQPNKVVNRIAAFLKHLKAMKRQPGNELVRLGLAAPTAEDEEPLQLKPVLCILHSIRRSPLVVLATTLEKSADEVNRELEGSLDEVHYGPFEDIF